MTEQFQLEQPQTVIYSVQSSACIVTERGILFINIQQMSSLVQDWV